MDYLKTNKFFMTALGQWPYRSQRFNQIIRTLIILSALSLFIPIIAALYYARNDFDNFLICLPMNVTGIIFFFSYIFFIIKTPEILVLLNRISHDFKQMKPFKEEITILKKSAGEGKTAVLIYSTYMATSILCFYSFSLIPQALDIFMPLNETREKMYVVEVEYIFFNKNNYYVFVYIQTIIVGTFAIFTITTCDIMLYSFIQHACGMYRVLWWRLQNIMSTKSGYYVNTKYTSHADNINKSVVNCVSLHNNILQYVEKLNSCYSVYLFVTYGCITLLMTFQGAMIVLKFNDMDFMIRYLTYYFGQIIHLLYHCIPGQKLKDHSIVVNEYLYASDWYNMPSREKKILLLMMIRSVRESKVSVGKFFSLSLETYSMLLKTIFSYLSVLISMTK